VNPTFLRRKIMVTVKQDNDLFVTIWNPSNDEIRLVSIFSDGEKSIPLPDGPVCYKEPGKDFYTFLERDEFIDLACAIHYEKWAAFLRESAPQLFS
jgi:hypothetical protein